MTAQTIKIWDFDGGVHPEENKHQSTGQPIAVANSPEFVVVPLNQHLGSPAKPIVKVGDKVKTGQVIAQADGFVSAPTHASITGIVTEIAEYQVPHASGLTSLCIKIENQGEDEWELLPALDLNSSDEALINRIKEAGLAGLGGAGFPTNIKYLTKDTIETLIINGAECEPYITADDMLMRERAKQVIDGTRIAQKILNAKEVLIGIEDNKPEAIAAIQKAVADSGEQTISVRVIPTKYPSGGEKQLIQILTGKQVPAGGLPSSLGIVCQNVGTVAAVAEAVLEGKPLVSRVVTLTGEALGTQCNLDVRLGTPISNLLQQVKVNQKKLDRLIMGGPMMGFTLPDANLPVIKTTNCILAPTKKELPPGNLFNACIRCGICEQVCPADLLPQQLYWYSKSKNWEQLELNSLSDCIECGACAYVCPSQIPLVQYYRFAKGEIRKEQAEHEKSDNARIRFEARQERLAQEAAEKEAKRKARAEAAAKAKAAKSGAEGSAKPEISDSVKEAIARAKAKKAVTDSASTSNAPALTKEQLEAKWQNAVAKAEKAEARLNDAKENDDPMAVALEKSLAKLKEKALLAKEQLDNFQEPPDKAEPAKVVLTKEQLEAKLKAAQAKLEKTQAKFVEANENNDPMAEALEKSLAKLREKVEAAKAQLDSFNESDSKETQS